MPRPPIIFLILTLTTFPAWAEDINSDFLKAAYIGNTSTIKALLNKGAYIDAKSRSKWTALMYASNRGYFSTVQVLLDKEADMEEKDRYGYTALMLAALSGHTKIVQVLLNKGADVTVKAKNGFTALKLAKDEGHKKIVMLLKNAGDINSDYTAIVPEESKDHNVIDIPLRQKKFPKDVVTRKTPVSKGIYSGWFYLGKFDYDKGKWIQKVINVRIDGGNAQQNACADCLASDGTGILVGLG